MARTLSTSLELGLPAPEFALPEPLTGKTVTLSEWGTAKGLLVLFMCNHCPYVLHILDQLLDFARAYQARGLAVVAISANDIEAYPDDSPEHMAALAKAKGFTFPYLYDADQSVARAYRAACTPDIYLFDADRRLVYHGQFDASRPRTEIPVTGADLRHAADALLAGEGAVPRQQPSMGCNIKWKPGNEPDYYG